MAVINRSELRLREAGVSVALFRLVSAQIASDFWAWYEAGGKEERVSARFKIPVLRIPVKVDVRLADVEPLLVIVFGPKPYVPS